MSDDANIFFAPLVKRRILLCDRFLQEIIKYKVFTINSKDFFFHHECQAFLSHYENKEDAVEKAATPSSPSVPLDPFRHTLHILLGFFGGIAVTAAGIIKCFRKNT